MAEGDRHGAGGKWMELKCGSELEHMTCLWITRGGGRERELRSAHRCWFEHLMLVPIFAESGKVIQKQGWKKITSLLFSMMSLKNLRHPTGESSKLIELEI